MSASIAPGVRIPVARAHRRAAGVQPLARAAGRARHSPVHRHGLRLLRVLAAAVEGLGITQSVACPKDMSLLAAVVHHAPATGRSRRSAWTYTLFFVFLGASAATWGGWLERAGPRKAGVVSARLLVRRARHLGRRRDRASGVAAVARVGRHRRHRPRARLHLAGVDAHQVVSGSARHGDRHGHHGLRRRRDDRLAARGPADEALRHARRRSACGRRSSRSRRSTSCS